ncbi:MAG: hypothetical protein VX672_04070 [Planctomycetota bacterium]|nr:hypothetical protein [Planctomycetota bacterium]
MIQIDSGWPFLLAGLAMLAAIALVPQQMAVEDAEATLWEAQEHERLLLARIDAAKSMKQDLVDQKPDLMHRLAMRRPPQKPIGTTVLVRQSRLRSVPELFEEVVDESFVPGRVPRPATGSTMLASLVGSGLRLWLVAGSAVAIFMGLILGGAGEPLVREAARKLLRRQPPSAEAIAQPHLFDDGVRSEEAFRAEVEDEMVLAAEGEFDDERPPANLSQDDVLSGDAAPIVAMAGDGAGFYEADDAEADASAGDLEERYEDVDDEEDEEFDEDDEDEEGDAQEEEFEEEDGESDVEDEEDVDDEEDEEFDEDEEGDAQEEEDEDVPTAGTDASAATSPRELTYEPVSEDDTLWGPDEDEYREP